MATDEPGRKKILNRRNFVTAGALGAAGLAAGCDCAEQCGTSGPTAVGGGAVRELKMVTSWPKNFPGLGTAAERVAQLITEMSGGSLRVKVFSAGELVGAFDCFDAVSSGAADLYHAADYYWVGKSKAYSFFTSVPFGMTAIEIAGWTEFGGGQQLWDELSAPFNIKPFAAGNTGHQLGGWFRREINTVEDLRGLKVRMPGLGGEMMRRVGAAAVALPGNELYQALQSGAIDGTEWVGPWNDLAFGFQELAPYYYWPGIHEPGAQLSIGLNLGVWNELTLAERMIIKSACQAATYQSLAEYDHANGVALEVLIREHGVQLREFPEEVLQALKTAADEVLAETAQEGELEARIYESFLKARAQSSAWGRISDEAYMVARRRLAREAPAVTPTSE